MRWTTTAGEYSPADGWALKYSFRGPGQLDVDATPAGAGYAVVLSAAATGALAAGAYRWAKYATKGDERHTVGFGQVLVTPNLAGTTGDGRTHAERMLAAIEARLEGRMTADVESYTIAGRALTKIPFAELAPLRAKYAAEVAAQRAAAAGQPRALARPVRVRFGQAGPV